MLKASPELRLCADAHEQEVITKDSYEIAKLFDRDKGIEYVVDIGANIGCFALQIRKFYPNCEIIVCEPEPELMKYNKENNGVGPHYVQAAVVGDPNLKTVAFSVCKWQGNHHVKGKFRMDTYAPVGSEIVGEIQVPAITLKELIKDYNFPRIDLLKIDTEGSEPDILTGAQGWLHNVRHIVGEWHSQADLAVIKAVLEPTHSVTIEDGAFHELDGKVANGNFYGELRNNI